MRSLNLLALPPVFALLSCASVDSETLVERRGDTLVFSGRVTASAVARLDRALRPTDTLVLSSAGGDEHAGLNGAKAIARRNVTIRIDGVCASACVDMFLAGDEKYVPRGSGVFFHLSALAWEAAAKRDPDMARKQEAIQTSMKALYEDVGVSLELQRCADRLLAPNFGEAGRPRDAVDVKYQAVFLPRRVLEHYGVTNIREYHDLRVTEKAVDIAGVYVRVARFEDCVRPLVAPAPSGSAG